VLHHDKHRSRIVQGIKGFIHKVTNTLAGNRN
jgi:hypothetical protein